MPPVSKVLFLAFSGCACLCDPRWPSLGGTGGAVRQAATTSASAGPAVVRHSTAHSQNTDTTPCSCAQYPQYVRIVHAMSCANSSAQPQHELASCACSRRKPSRGGASSARPLPSNSVPRGMRAAYDTRRATCAAAAAEGPRRLVRTAARELAKENHPLCAGPQRAPSAIGRCDIVTYRVSLRNVGLRLYACARAHARVCAGIHARMQNSSWAGAYRGIQARQAPLLRPPASTRVYRRIRARRRISHAPTRARASAASQLEGTATPRRAFARAKSQPPLRTCAATLLVGGAVDCDGLRAAT
jgi:hypothetical protein